MDVDAPVLDHHQLNLTCQKLCNREDDIDLEYCELVLRQLKLAFETLQSPNELPTLLPNAVKFLSFLCNKNFLSKKIVRVYVECLVALHGLGSRGGCLLIQRWVARRLWHALSLDPGAAGPPTPSRVAIALRRARDTECEVSENALSALSKSLEENLRHSIIFSKDEVHQLVISAAEVLRHGKLTTREGLFRQLCDLFDIGRINLEDCSTKTLLESCPPILERLLLIEVTRQCDSTSDYDDDDVGRSSRLLKSLATCASSSSGIFRTSLNILFTLYTASHQHLCIRKIILGFLVDVKSKVTTPEWVSVFDPNIQPLILMMQDFPQEMDRAFGEKHRAAVRSLADEMLTDGVLDRKSLELLLQLHPLLNSVK